MRERHRDDDGLELSRSPVYLSAARPGRTAYLPTAQHQRVQGIDVAAHKPSDRAPNLTSPQPPTVGFEVECSLLRPPTTSSALRAVELTRRPKSRHSEHAHLGDEVSIREQKPPADLATMRRLRSSALAAQLGRQSPTAEQAGDQRHIEQELSSADRSINARCRPEYSITMASCTMGARYVGRLSTGRRAFSAIAP